MVSFGEVGEEGAAEFGEVGELGFGDLHAGRARRVRAVRRSE